MKSIGIVRRLDELGRIVIPRELRKTFDIKEKDPLEIFVDGDKIILRKYSPSISCVFCEESKAEALIHFKNIFICSNCFNLITEKKVESVSR